MICLGASNAGGGSARQLLEHSDKIWAGSGPEELASEIDRMPRKIAASTTGQARPAGGFSSCPFSLLILSMAWPVPVGVVLEVGAILSISLILSGIMSMAQGL